MGAAGKMASALSGIRSAQPPGQTSYEGEANWAPQGVKVTIGNTWDGEKAEANEEVAVSVRTVDEEVIITVDAPFHKDPAPPGPAGSTDQLWDYEVVEVFILGRAERYLEVEMSPHGHYLVLKLQGARNIVASGIPLDFSVTTNRAGPTIYGNRWTGVARIPKALLPDGPYSWNAYSIHGTGADRRYLSLYPVPGPGYFDDVADFHRIGFFRPIDLGFTSTEPGWLGVAY